MSEFSDSYHLRAGEQQAGVDLLHAAGLGGYVFPPENGWVTVVAEGEAFEPNQRLIGASAGVLLHYVHAADHGWGFELYRDGRRLARYEAEWANDIRVDADELDLRLLEEVFGDGIRALDDAAYHSIFMPDFDEFMEQVMGDEGPPAERFAEAAGLPNVSWLSWSYVDSDYDDEPELAAQGVVRVDAAWAPPTAPLRCHRGRVRRRGSGRRESRYASTSGPGLPAAHLLPSRHGATGGQRYGGG